jgi:hypothetical protein
MDEAESKKAEFRNRKPEQKRPQFAKKKSSGEYDLKKVLDDEAAKN